MEEKQGVTMFEWKKEKSKGKIKNVADNIKKMVEDLHEKGFVHGDLRPNNIIIDESDAKELSFWIIDFDWAGVVNEARYPLFMNHKGITWPKGAEDGELIMTSHDLEMVSRLYSQ